MPSRFANPANIEKTRARFGKAVVAKLRERDHAGLQYCDPSSDEKLFEAALDHFIVFDPTTEKRYVLWMLARYVQRTEGGIRLFEDLPKVGEDLAIYDRLRITGYFKRDKVAAAIAGDILTLDTETLFIFVERFRKKPIESNAEAARSFEENLISSGQAQIVLDTELTKIVIPHSGEAARHFGKNTRWCTTSQQTFNHYNNKGALYIVLDKKQNKRWQFHFGVAQFMNELDCPLDNLKNIPAEARAYFGDDLKIYFEPDTIRDFSKLTATQIAYVLRKKPTIIGRIPLISLGETKMSDVIDDIFISAFTNHRNRPDVLYEAAAPDMRDFIKRQLIKYQRFFEIAPAALKTKEALDEFIQRRRNARYESHKSLPDNFFKYVPRTILCNAHIAAILALAPGAFLSLPNEFKKAKLIDPMLREHPQWVKHVREPSYDIQHWVITRAPQFITALAVIDRGLKAQAIAAVLKVSPGIDLLRYPTLSPTKKDADHPMWRQPRPPKGVPPPPAWTRP